MRGQVYGNVRYWFARATRRVSTSEGWSPRHSAFSAMPDTSAGHSASGELAHALYASVQTQGAGRRTLGPGQ